MDQSHRQWRRAVVVKGAAALLVFAGASRGANLSDTINALIPTSGLNLTFNGLTPFAIADGGNVGALRQEVYNNWAYPDGEVNDGTATVRSVTNLGNAGPLDPGTVANHMSFLGSGLQSLQPGDRVYTTAWTLTDPTFGTFNFTSMAYEDEFGEAKFEPVFETMPSLGESDERGNRYIRRTRNDPNDVNFRVRRHFGGSVAASGWGDLTIRCDSAGHITSCVALPGDSQSFLWEAKTTNSPPRTYVQDGVECCEAAFFFAFSNGFKSVKIGADGFTLEVTGSIGWGGRDSALVTKCCDPIPAPSGVCLAAVGGLFASRRRR